nr:aldo-keto reductase dtxs3 [Quercus suber]
MSKFSRVPISLSNSVQNTNAQYRKLGSSGLRVSNPILGGLSFGSSKYAEWVLDEEKVNSCTEHMLPEDWFKLEMELMQCLVGYNKHIFEWRIREVDCESNGEIQHTKEPTNHYDQMLSPGLTRVTLMCFKFTDLTRLYLQRKQCTLCRHISLHTLTEMSRRALDDLIRAGTVRYIGASSMWAYQFAALQYAAESKGYTKFISMQNHYNLLYREEEREMNPFCDTTGVGLIPVGPVIAATTVPRPVS